ncbi:hypothetical protein TURU_081868 [Turdus rufiventris]|nr:hypothetical protein TURU_081868 [Turdus rufiventris]
MAKAEETASQTQDDAGHVAGPLVVDCMLGVQYGTGHTLPPSSHNPFYPLLPTNPFPAHNPFMPVAALPPPSSKYLPCMTSLCNPAPVCCNPGSHGHPSHLSGPDPSPTLVSHACPQGCCGNREKTYLSLNPMMNPIQVVFLLTLNSLAAAWIVPQPRQNIVVTLAQTLQQETYACPLQQRRTLCPPDW